MAAALEQERERPSRSRGEERVSVGSAQGVDIGSRCPTAGPDLEGDAGQAAQAADSNQQERAFAFFLRDTASPLKSLQAAERQRAEVARARRRWMREQGMLDPARLVFIDETAVSTNMVRLRGRSPRGKRLV